MKKLLCLLIAMILCLSIVGCGNNKETASNNKNNETVYIVGETIINEQVEFAITEYSFHKCLSNFGDEKFLNPIEENDEKAYLYYVSDNPYNADDEHIILKFEYEYKNVGKKEFDEINSFSLEYGDGYLFDDISGSAQRTDGSFGGLGDIEPLSEKVFARAAVKLPKEVFENENEPIIVKVKLPSETEEVLIKLR